jgi:hypothetical protein
MIKIEYKLLIIALVITSLINGCGPFLSNTSTADTKTGLISKDDFLSNEWDWPVDQSGSSGPEMIIISGQKVEKTSVYFLGKSRFDNDGFLVQHFLYRYETQLSANYLDAFTLGDFEVGSTELPFKIEKMGNISQARCVVAASSDQLLYCSIRAKFMYIESQLNIIGYWKGDKQKFENLVNTAVLKLNEKIKRIDEPYVSNSATEPTVLQ